MMTQVFAAVAVGVLMAADLTAQAVTDGTQRRFSRRRRTTMRLPESKPRRTWRCRTKLATPRCIWPP